MIDDTLVAYADAGVGWAVQFLEDLKYRISIPLTDTKRESGHCWAFRLPQLAGWADTLQNPTRSPLVVLEDGVPLGPPHSTHEAIRSKGGGAFSHWGNVLYFSSRDRSDFAENGRRYVAAMPRAYNS